MATKGPTAILEDLKTGFAGVVYGDDFAVDGGGVGVDTADGGDDGGEVGAEWFVF